MAALTTRPHTLAVDLDLLVSSSSSEDADETAGPEPSFTYFVGERPASASPTTRTAGNYSDSFARQASECSLTRHAWLRPGIRRFLLAVHPHFRTVLVVRRRCGARQRCGCRTECSFSADGSHHICDWDEAVCEGGRGGSGIGAGAQDWVEDVGGCSAALLAAALPAIDPDGQFFGQRVVLVQEQPRRPRPAIPKPSRASSAAGVGDDADFSRAGLASAAAGTALFPARARRLSALPAALREHPSSLLVVTTADRLLFCGCGAMDGSGSLAEQVVECQPYRKEYGKYDDVLDCLATVVTGLLAEVSVPEGLRRQGLLHSRLQPSLMMQALHAQQALRQGALRQGAFRQGAQQLPVGRPGVGRACTPGQGAQAAVAALPPQPQQYRQHEQLVGPGKEQRLRYSQQQRAAAAARKAGAGGSRGGSRRAGGSRGESCGGSGEGGGGGGSRGSGRMSCSSSAGLPAAGAPISAGTLPSPLPPIPELPLLELRADWPEDVAEGAPASPPPPSARSSASTSSSSTSACSARYSSPHASSPPQSECLSSPSALSGGSDAAGSGGSRPSCSSSPSSSSGGGRSLSSQSMSAFIGAGGATGPAVSSPPPSVRRTAWDATPDSFDGALRAGIEPPPAGTGGGGGGVEQPRGGGTGDGRRGGALSVSWRPSSFPAAIKPPVTRHMSDCAPQVPGSGDDAAKDGAEIAAAPPPSPFTSAANAVAAATSRLFARILGGRHRRRCRPSDAGEDAAAGGTSRFGSISVAAALGRSAASDSLASRWWMDGGPGCAAWAAAAQHGKGHMAACTSAAVAAPPPSLLPASPDDRLIVRPASVATASLLAACSPAGGGPDDDEDAPPRSASAASPAAATTAPVVSLGASGPPPEGSPDTQPRPAAWSDPSGPLRVPHPLSLRAAHSADGRDSGAAEAAAAATGASPQRLSALGRLSAASGAGREQPVATLRSRPAGQCPAVPGEGGRSVSGRVPAGEAGRRAARCSAAALAAAAEAGVPPAVRAAAPLSGTPAGSLGSGVAAALFPAAAATATAR